LTFAPSLIANDAQVWRRSCSRTPSHPSTARRRLGEGVARLAKRQVTAARGLEHQRAAIAAWLADPTDLAFNEDHLDDPDALAAAGRPAGPQASPGIPQAHGGDRAGRHTLDRHG
jgi:hypothetical protein